MLYWICPECGGECSPAVRECPTCAGTTATSPVLVAPAPRKQARTEDVLALIHNVPPTASTPLASDSGREPGQNGHSGFKTATLELPERLDGLAETTREQEPPTPHQDAIESLVRPLIDSAPPLPPSRPDPVFEPALQLDSSTGLRPRAEICEIVSSFKDPGKAALLSAPPEVVVAPAPPALQCIRLPKPRLSPVPPKTFDPANLMFGLQAAPLAGPCVPPQLRNLGEQLIPPRKKARKKAGLPAWIVSALVAVILFLGVGSLLQYWAANRDTKSGSPSSQASDPPATLGHQSSTSVEVTGLRVLPGTKRAQLEFIVVNHSGTPLTNVGLNIAVRSSSSGTQTLALFTISTTIPSLAPYQSREFRAELDPELRASDIPDWQSLHADVSVVSQP